GSRGPYLLGLPPGAQRARRRRHGLVPRDLAAVLPVRPHGVLLRARYAGRDVRTRAVRAAGGEARPAALVGALRAGRGAHDAHRGVDARLASRWIFGTPGGVVAVARIRPPRAHRQRGSLPVGAAGRHRPAVRRVADSHGWNRGRAAWSRELGPGPRARGVGA